MDWLVETPPKRDGLRVIVELLETVRFETLKHIDLVQEMERRRQISKRVNPAHW